MKKKYILWGLGALVLMCLFFVRTYTSSFGYGTQDMAEAFAATKPTCYGIDILLNPMEVAADAGGKSLCIGLLLSPQKSTAFDAKNSSFTLDGKTITLTSGIHAELIPRSSAKIVTRYFGNEATGDLNRDGRADTAFLVTQESSGSGVFYYAVVAFTTDTGYKTTNAFLIGDRIAPQNNRIVSGELHINYAERKPGEPFSTPPSQGAVKLLKVTPAGVLEGLMK